MRALLMIVALVVVVAIAGCSEPPIAAKGEKGDPGEPGPAGAQGAKGYLGAAGATFRSRPPSRRPPRANPMR